MNVIPIAIKKRNAGIISMCGIILYISQLGSSYKFISAPEYFFNLNLICLVYLLVKEQRCLSLKSCYCRLICLVVNEAFPKSRNTFNIIFSILEIMKQDN